MPLQLEAVSNKPFRYVPVEFRDESNPPAILMQKLKPIRAAELRDESFQLNNRGKLKSVRMISVRTKTVVAQLCGWENMEVGGMPIAFDSSPKAQEDMFSMLPAVIQQELESVFGGGKYDAEAEARFVAAKNEPDDDDDDDDEDEEVEDGNNATE